MSKAAIRFLIAGTLFVSAVPAALMMASMGFEVLSPVSWYLVVKSVFQGVLDLPGWFVMAMVWVLLASAGSVGFVVAGVAGSGGSRSPKTGSIFADEEHKVLRPREPKRVVADLSDRDESVGAKEPERMRMPARDEVVKRLKLWSGRAVRATLKLTKRGLVMMAMTLRFAGGAAVEVVRIMMQSGQAFERRRREATFALKERFSLFVHDTRRMFSEDEMGVGAEPKSRTGATGGGGMFGALRRKPKAGDSTDEEGGWQANFAAAGDPHTRGEDEEKRNGADGMGADQIAQELLSWYAIWTRTMPAQRTERMQQEAQALWSQIDTTTKGVIFDDYGMRGASALQALRAAVGKEASEKTSGAAPLEKPTEAELSEATKEGGPDARRPQDLSAHAAQVMRAEAEERGESQRAPATPPARKAHHVTEAPTQRHWDDGPTYDAADAFKEGDDPSDQVGSSLEGLLGRKGSKDDTVSASADDFMAGLDVGDEGGEADRQGPTGATGSGSVESVGQSDPEDDEIPMDAPPEAEAAYQNWDQEALDVTDDMPDLSGEPATPDDEEDRRDRMAEAARESVAYGGGEKRTSDGPSWMEDALDLSDADDLHDVHESDVEASSIVPAEEVDDTIQAMGRKGLEAAVGVKRSSARGAASLEVTEAGLEDLAERSPFLSALWQQVSKMIAFQTQAYAWERLGDTPPPEYDTDAKRRAFMVRTASAIIGLREQVPQDVLDEVQRRKEGSEHARWMGGRADQVLQSSLRDQSGVEARALIGAQREGDASRFLDYEIREAWKVTAPIMREYREKAARIGVKSYRSTQINPMPSGQESDELFDMIDLIIGEQRGLERPDGTKVKAVGIAFVIVPAGKWTLKEISRDKWEERYALVAQDRSDGVMIRMRDRSLRIFDAWADIRGLDAMRVCHVVLKEGAEIEGHSDPERVADVLQTKFGDREEVGCEIRTAPWTAQEWADHIAPLVKP